MRVSQPTNTARGRSACHSRSTIDTSPVRRFPGLPFARRIERGSAWNARCANESPSITSSARPASGSWLGLARRGCHPSSAEPPREPLQSVDRLAQPIGRELRRLGGVELREVGGVDRRTVGDPQRAEPAEPLGSRDPGRNERHAGLERDPRGPGVPTCLVRLAQTLRAACPLGKHHDGVALAAQRDCCVDRLLVALAAIHAEPATGAHDPSERRPEELLLGHEAQEAAWKQRDAERPRIEVRPVVRGDDATAVRDVLAPGRAEPEGELQHRPAEHRDERVEPAGTRRARHPRAGYARPPAKRRATPSLPCSTSDQPRHRRVPRQGADDRRLPGRRFRRGVEHRPHPRPARTRERHPSRAQEALEGEARRGRRARVRPVLRRRCRTRSASFRAPAEAPSDADVLLLATDEDREGEAIAWHLPRGAEAEGAGPAHGLPRDHARRDPPRARRDPRHRRAPRRRAGDAPHPRPPVRYEVSPVLWKKVMPRLSAGRVQSVATRLVVERERERMRVRRRRATGTSSALRAGGLRGSARRRRRHAHRPGQRLRRDGRVRGRVCWCWTRSAPAPLPRACRGRTFTVGKVDEKPYTRRPAAPFRRRRCSRRPAASCASRPSTTMSLAQRLYENGHITYMRTDSVTLSDAALKAARAHVAREHGPTPCPSSPDATSEQGRERTGGARGDPAGRRRLPDARRARPRARSRRARACTSSSGSGRSPPR